VRFKTSVVLGAAAAVVAVALPLLALPASAGTTPPWEPDPADALGTLSFYNSAGQVITGGSSLTQLFAFAEASTTDPYDGGKAYIQFAQPVPSTPVGNFPASATSAASSFPVTSPASLAGTANPVFTASSTDVNLQSFINQTTPQTAAGYANVFQIRLYTSGGTGGGTAGNTEQWWDADIVVNTTAGTWTEEYPTQGASAVTTTTAVSANPTGSANQGASIALTATVSAADSSQPAGTVQFSDTIDGVTDTIGSPVTVTYASSSATTGTATLSTSALLPSPPGGYSLTATFTPSNTSSYSPSTSAGASYTVDPVANKPTISGKHQVGQSETCTDGTLDFGVTATYVWFANTTKIGTGAKITVPASAYNKQLTCQASVSDGGGPANTATSASVKVSLGAALKDTKKPTLSGAHKVGKTERVKAGTWPKGAKFTYQWLLNGKVIKHATKSTFKPTRSDKGKKLSCRVTASVSGYAKGSATTSSVKVSS